ncbi:Threonine synthase [Smittium culicis]|uniref:threonine synthase n=4 Tax=Smittium culicis TaxID=133412 RepID=A0A1R1XVK1_9FUNG|nr:Threonine synthase [Smittium culicis]
MHYRSTRGKASGYTFEEAVMTGLASDGGLFIPNEIPKLPSDFLTKWKDYSFAQLSLEILSLFIDETEIPRADLKKIIDASYSTFTNKDIVPSVQIDKESDLWILELFHGPTFAFKDVALQFLGNLFEFFLKRRNSQRKAESDPVHRLTIVGATSGDTGGAAIYGLKGKENVSVFILHPNNRVSPIQKAQMTTVLDDNIHNVAVEGTFDNCQDIVKALFGREDFRIKHSLGAINSINWARILAQIVYYFHCYFTIVRAGRVDPKIVFFTPTGNFGDILAGHYAVKLGLPVSKLVVSTNSNNIVDRFFKTGKYEKGVEGVLETPSPAMDILISSNFERFCWYIAYECEATGPTEEDRISQAGQIISKWMDDLKSTGKFEVSEASLIKARKEFSSGTTSDDQTIKTINKYYKIKDSDSKKNYLLDPHTAVGVNLANTMRDEISNELGYSDYISVCLSTAHPSKFVEAVEKSLSSDFPEFDINPLLPQQFVGILQKEQRCEYLPNDTDAIAKFVESKAQY